MRRVFMHLIVAVLVGLTIWKTVGLNNTQVKTSPAIGDDQMTTHALTSSVEKKSGASAEVETDFARSKNPATEGSSAPFAATKKQRPQRSHPKIDLKLCEFCNTNKVRGL